MSDNESVDQKQLQLVEQKKRGKAYYGQDNSITIRNVEKAQRIVIEMKNQSTNTKG